MINKTASQKFYAMVDAELEKLAGGKLPGMAIVQNEASIAARAAKNAPKLPPPNLADVQRQGVMRSLHQGTTVDPQASKSRLKAKIHAKFNANMAQGVAAQNAPSLASRAGGAIQDASLKAHQVAGNAQAAVQKGLGAAAKGVANVGGKAIKAVDNAYTAAGQAVHGATGRAAAGVGSMKDKVVANVQASRARDAATVRAQASRYALTARSQRNAPQTSPAATPAAPQRSADGGVNWGHVAAAGGVGLLAAHSMKNNDE